VTELAIGDIVPILAPLMDALDGMAVVTEALAGTGIAFADSPAMSEMAQGSANGGSEHEESVHSAHSNAGILRFAGNSRACFGPTPCPSMPTLPLPERNWRLPLLATGLSPGGSAQSPEFSATKPYVCATVPR
jgi:hypothetical protein